MTSSRTVPVSGKRNSRVGGKHLLGMEQDFIRLRGNDLPELYRLFQVPRAEPVFIDIYDPLPFPTLKQFIRYFTGDMFWMWGKPSSPVAYFALHDFQHEHDLANFDFMFFEACQQLNRLVRINHFDMSQLSKIREPLELMMTCSGCTDDELLKSPLSLCPRCNFNPFGFEAAQSALESLAWCEQEFEKLHKSWTLQLLNELDDPSVRSSIQVLRAEERKLIDEFVSQKALPAEISDSFINAINTALKGLKRKSVKTQDFATYLRGDGAPLKAQELRERFNAWLNDQLAGSNDDSVRFVLED